MEQQLALIRPFIKQDVKQVLWTIHEVKSPGPDGYGSGFFLITWAEVEDDVTATVMKFFMSGKLLQSLSKTNLVLIPKTDVPRTSSDYR